MPPGRTWQRADTDNAKDTVLNQLGVIWKQHPNLRLGQLIANALIYTDQLFNVEDFDLLTVLRETYPEVRHDTETDPL